MSRQIPGPDPAGLRRSGSSIRASGTSLLTEAATSRLVSTFREAMLWRFAYNGVVFTGASSVTVTRYRYRGNIIPTPWTPAASS